MSNLLEKASIVTTPTAYDNGKILSVKPSIVLGSELVTNGDFATDSNWVKGTGWSISGGKAISNGSQSTISDIEQNITLTQGSTYIVKFDLIRSAGTLYPKVGNTTGTGLTSTQSVSQNIVAGSSNKLELRADANFIGSITNVSVKEAIDGDFDFTRNSSATRVNSQGLIEDMQILSSNLVSNGDFSQEGSEQVTNGDFATDSDWNLSSGAIISNGKLTVTNAAQFSQIATQANVVPTQKPCKLQFDIVVNSGSFRILLGSGGTSTQISASGTYTFYETSGNFGTISLQARTGGFDGSIDNVSVKEVGQDWDLGTGVTIGEDRAIFTSTASGQSVSQNAVASSLTNGALAKVSFEVLTRTEGSFGVYFSGTLVGTLASAGVFTAYFTKGTETSFYIRALGTTSGSITNISVIEITDDTNLPRIDYTDGVGSWLFEPQSTNLIPYSEDFTQWNKSNASLINTISSTVVSPDGVSYANKLYPIGSATSSFIIQGGSGNCFSVFVKKGERRWVLIYGGFSNSNVWFDSENGVFGNIFDNVVTVESFGNDWYKIKILWAQNSSHVRIYNTDSGTSTQSTGNGTDGLYIWGAQLEVQSFATSYIPTEGSIKTRLQDAAFGAGSSDLINSTEGVLYAEILRRQEINDNYDLITLNNGASNSDANSVSIGFDINSDDFFIRVKANGVSVFFNSNISASANQFHKVALKYKSGDCAVWIDGVEQDTGTTTFTFTQTLDNLTFDKGNRTLNFYGKTKALAVFKEALTDEELTCLTTI